jgi:WXXGXW repeat (2 copies)
MSYTRVALLGVLLLGGVIGVAQTTVIRIAPPPPVRVGVIGVAPGPGYVWVGGYQRWNGNGYVWVAGKWVRPPRAGVIWVAPRYGRSGGGWVYHKGYWR